MNGYIKRLKENKYDASFENTSDWLIKLNEKLLIQKNQRRTIKMKQYFLRHKLQFAIIILFAMLIAACNYPVSQNDTVGYVLTWTASKTDNNSVLDNLKKFDWYKNSNVSAADKILNGNEWTEYKLLVQSTDDKAVISCKNDLEKIKQITSIKIVPINQSVKRPVYSAALNSFFKIDINSSKMSDEQVQAEITRQLKDAGFDNASVSYKPDEKGRSRLEIKFPENINSGDNKTIQVDVDNDNSHQVIKMKTEKPDVDFSKMTDAEIRSYIKNQNKDDNLTDKDIQITREGSNVKININKQETK